MDTRIIDCHAHHFTRAIPQLSPAGNGTYTIDRLVQLMDDHDVAKAVLLQNPFIGSLNPQIAEAIAAHPGRFVGTIQVDPRSPNALESIDRFAALPNQNIVKFEMSAGYGWCGKHPDLKYDEPSLMRIWEHIANRKLSVILDLGGADEIAYQVEKIDAVTKQFSDTVFLLEHLGFLRRKDLENPDAIFRRRKLLELAKRSNVYLGLAAVPLLLGETTECPHAREELKDAVSRFGADKIVWGSDIPVTLKSSSYQWMIDFVAEAAFLKSREKAAILGGNAQRLFFE